MPTLPSLNKDKDRPSFTIMAGPNGAGKTTFIHKNLAHLLETHTLLNADDIAGAFPQEETNVDIKAARQFIHDRKKLFSQHQNLLIETTLATLSLKNIIQEAHLYKYKISLYYLWITEPSLCDFRVKNRVNQGGHNIPVDVIFRRYAKSLSYLKNYIDLVDEAFIYFSDENPKLVAQKDDGAFHITEQGLWNDLETAMTLLS